MFLNGFANVFLSTAGHVHQARVGRLPHRQSEDFRPFANPRIYVLTRVVTGCVEEPTLTYQISRRILSAWPDERRENKSPLPVEYFSISHLVA